MDDLQPPLSRAPVTSPEIRFLAWGIGIVELVGGLMMLLLPFLFEGAVYDSLRPRLVPFGLLGSAVGLLLLVWQFLRLETTRLPRFSLLAGGIVALASAVASVKTETFTATPFSVAFGVVAILAAFGAESNLPARVAKNLFAAALAVSMAGSGAVLVLQRDLSSTMYQYIRPHPGVWAIAMFAGAAMLALWVHNPGSGLKRLWPVLAGVLLLLWNYEYAFRNQAPLAMTASLAAVAAIVRPFIADRWLVAPPSRIVNRFVATSTLLVGVALVLLVLVLFAQTEHAYEQRAQRDLLTTAQLTGTDSAALVQNQLRIGVLLARDADIQSFDPPRQIAALQRTMATDPAASLISIANGDGIAVARSTGEQPGIDRRQEIEGMARLFETHQPNWDLIQSPTLGVPVIVIRVPISGPQGEFEGGLAIQVRLSTLNGQLQSLLTSLGGRIIIVDSQGRVIAHPDASYVTNRTNLSASPPVLAAREGRMAPLIYRDGGRRWLAAPIYIKELGWTVDAERPQLLVLAPSIQAREQATVFLLIVLLISGTIAYAFAQDLIRPVAKLVHAARSLGEGATEADLPAGGDDEVGELVHAFSEMRDRLVARTEERERAVDAAAELVQELRQSEERFRQQALSDALTDLPNRMYFMDRLNSEVEAAKEQDRTLAVLFLDLDGFKTINDSLGHALGDEMLIAIGERLKAACGGREHVARFGGDEFAVLLESSSPADALATANRLLGELRQPIESGPRDLVISASFGIAVGGSAQMDAVPEDLLRQADIALYQAKANGKSQAVLFTQQMSALVMERWALENDLGHALARGQLRLFYQPIFDLRDDSVVAVEALLRWQHPQRGLLEPELFILLAEETGLILEIGSWVLMEACTEAQAQRARLGESALPMSVNLSARQLHEPDVVEHVASILQATGLDPASLELELTESVIMRDREGSISKLEALKELGVRITIDDFGTGYSSLSYLQRLPVDGLKIDRSFVNAISGDPGSLGIVSVVIDLAHARGLTVTAEGVESAAQLEELRALGCDRGQGYYLALPAPPLVPSDPLPAQPPRGT